MIPLQGGPAGTPAGAPQPGAPGIARAAGIGGSADSSVKAATAFEDYTNGYANRKSTLDNLRTAASNITTGPQAPFWGNVGRVFAGLGVTTPFTPTSEQAAAYEEVRKLAVQALSQQKEALGLPNTNQSVSLTTGASPNEENTPLGLQRLLGVVEGTEQYAHATRQAWETWKSQNHTGETYNAWLAGPKGWMSVFDPRVFQAQYMDPAQKAAVRNTVGPKRFDAEEAAATRLGYLGGQ